MDIEYEELKRAYILKVIEGLDEITALVLLADIEEEFGIWYAVHSKAKLN